MVEIVDVGSHGGCVTVHGSVRAVEAELLPAEGYHRETAFVQGAMVFTA